MVQTLSTWPTAVTHGQVAASILEQFILKGFSFEPRKLSTK
jgi:hypothetical protein